MIAHPSYKLAETCLNLVSPQMFWSISNQYPDLVTRLHVQIRLMGNFGFTACVPWTIRADESLCFVCKEAKDDFYHFLFDCSYFRKNFDSLWSNLDVKASNSSPTDRVFPRPFTHGGDLSPPYGGDKALMGGGQLMRGDIDLMGGGLTLTDYITMQFIDYDSIKTR